MHSIRCICVSGTSGAPINLVSNLFKLERAPNFHLFQYRVDYNPEVPSRGMRKSMLKEHQDLIGSIYQFDGMALFLPIRLEREVLCDGWNIFTADVYNLLIWYWLVRWQVDIWSIKTPNSTGHQWFFLSGWGIFRVTHVIWGKVVSHRQKVLLIVAVVLTVCQE